MVKSKLICGITMGDAAGIGPEVILKSLKEKQIRNLADFLIIGNSFILKRTARILKIRLKIKRIDNINELSQLKNKNIILLDIGDIRKVEFGRAISNYGLVALDCIDTALKLIKNKEIDVLVTAPVNKHAINQARLSYDKRTEKKKYFFKGHTEYIASSCRVKDFAMMLTGGPFKIILVTRHIALKDVAAELSKEKIYRTISLAVFSLKKYFGIHRPRIGVCALNPHSGEAGLMGTEEIRIIRPAVKKAEPFTKITGPLPADTIFYSVLQGDFDAVIAMYHDQGLIPLKTFALHQGVNLTLGLPFVRTSPDHGTAYDIAGKNKANPGSMIEAVKLAVEIGSRIKNNK